MQSDVANVQDLDVVPKVGYGEANRLVLHRAVGDLQAAGGGALLLPAGVYEFTGTIDLEPGAATSTAGVLRVMGDSEPTLQHWDENLFVIADTTGNAAVGHVAFEARFQVDRGRVGP